MGRPSKYSAELKERAVRLALESDRPISHVAADLSIGPESLRSWVRQAQADGAGPDGSPGRLTTDERELLRKLQRENRDLKRANQILKDASVFFAKELISDRVWRTRSQLEIAIVEWVGWYNNARLHSSLGDVPPAEIEHPDTGDRVGVTGSPSGLPGHAHPAKATINQPN